MEQQRHMESPANVEYMLCGEAYDGEDGAEFLVVAKGGQAVTCPLCRAVIDACRALRGYRVPN